MSGILSTLRQRAVDVKPDELRALGLAFVFNFIVLGSYYVVRPIRDALQRTEHQMQELEKARREGKPIFSGQYHPEASPGPRDARYLFREFADAIGAEEVV